MRRCMMFLDDIILHTFRVIFMCATLSGNCHKIAVTFGVFVPKPKFLLVGVANIWPGT